MTVFAAPLSATSMLPTSNATSVCNLTFTGIEPTTPIASTANSLATIDFDDLVPLNMSSSTSSYVTWDKTHGSSPLTPPTTNTSSSNSSLSYGQISANPMSPDSTWSGTSSASVASQHEMLATVQHTPPPDSHYDSDAFNSDDSHESLLELGQNPRLIDDIRDEIARHNLRLFNLQQHQQQLQATSTIPDSTSERKRKLPPTTEDGAKVDDQPAKKTRKRRSAKRPTDKVLQCDQCSYVTKFKEHLTSHMHTHNGARNYMCVDCGQTFKWSHSLKRHQRTHQAVFKYACKYCQKAFTRKDHMTIHENLHVAPPQVFNCDECGATFKNKKILNGHLKTHAAVKMTFKCDHCDSEFTRRASLTRHINASHSQTRLNCELCPAQFGYKSALEDHKRCVHGDGSRDFACPHCSLRFSLRGYLTKHMATAHAHEICNANRQQQPQQQEQPPTTLKLIASTTAVSTTPVSVDLSQAHEMPALQVMPTTTLAPYSYVDSSNVSYGPAYQQSPYSHGGHNSHSFFDTMTTPSYLPTIFDNNTTATGHQTTMISSMVSCSADQYLPYLDTSLSSQHSSVMSSTPSVPILTDLM